MSISVTSQHLCVNTLLDYIGQTGLNRDTTATWKISALKSSVSSAQKQLTTMHDMCKKVKCKVFVNAPTMYFELFMFQITYTSHHN
jgi:hypothetical protein